MAIVQNPFIGQAAGKFAGAIFSKQFGKHTMRSKPISVHNPNTLAQRTQRMKFSMLIALARMILGFVQIGYKQMAVGMSAFNAFVGENIKLIIAGAFPAFTIDWTALIVCHGTLFGVSTPTVTAAAGKKITPSWADNSGDGDALATDVALILLINSTKDIIKQDVSTAFRTTGTLEIVVPDTLGLSISS